LATVLGALSFLAPACMSALGSQNSDAAPRNVSVPSEDIFSGTLKQFTDGSITVVHKVTGRQAVTREFTRDAGTTIEGKLRIAARVTVRYKALGNGGFVAVHIIVRPIGRAG
jgi:hypothetical protein